LKQDDIAFEIFAFSRSPRLDFCEQAQLHRRSSHDSIDECSDILFHYMASTCGWV
jgi:hypothetical protein